MLAAGAEPEFDYIHNPELVRILVEAGADPNQPNRNGDLPIDLESGLGYTEVVKELLRHGAVPSERANLLAGRRPFTGVQALLASGTGNDLSDELDEQAVSRAAARAIRILDEDRAVTISLDTVLVLWRRDGDRYHPVHWIDTGHNIVSWIEPDPTTDGRLLLASRDAGVVAALVEGDTLSMSGTVDDSCGSRQVVCAVNGQWYSVPEVMGSVGVFQAEWLEDRLLLLDRADDMVGDDYEIRLRIVDPANNQSTWEWQSVGVPAFFPMAMAVSSDQTLVCVAFAHPKNESSVWIVNLSTGEAVMATLDASRSSPLPRLQSVCAMPDQSFLVAFGPTVTRVTPDGSQKPVIESASDILAISSGSGATLLATSAGLNTLTQI